MTIDRTDEPDNRPKELNESKTIKRGFSDPSGSSPKESDLFQSSINKSARGQKSNTLNLGGGQDGISLDISDSVSQYPYNRVMETPSGHVVEYDDTPGAERILIKHTSGSGIEFKSDGTTIQKTENNSITSINGSSCVIIEGDVNIQINGNLNLNVNGDMKTKVGGDYTLDIEGSKTTKVQDNQSEKIVGNKETVIKGDESLLITGDTLETRLNNKTEIIKGNKKTVVQGNILCSSSGNLKFTSQSNISITGKNLVMASSRLSILTVSGTIGGENLSYKGKSYKGTTFHGSLNGTAQYAKASETAQLSVWADEAGMANQGATTKPGGVTYNINITDINPTYSSGDVSEYITANVKQISIDEGNHIKNSVDMTESNFGIDDKPLDTKGIRTALREPTNINNQNFVGQSVVSGKLNPRIVQPFPQSIESISGKEAESRIPTEFYNNSLNNSIVRIKTTKNINIKKFIPNPFYNINKLNTPITESTKLSRNIMLSRFIKGNLNCIKDETTKQALARQYLLFVDAMESIIDSKGEFVNHRLVVVDGYYKQGTGETLTSDSINYYANKGRAITMELHDSQGNIDHDKTFEMALYFRDLINYDSLELSYDYFNTDNSLTTQLIMIQPEVDSEYNIVGNRYKNELKTWYNGKVQANELVKINTDEE